MRKAREAARRAVRKIVVRFSRGVAIKPIVQPFKITLLLAVSLCLAGIPETSLAESALNNQIQPADSAQTEIFMWMGSRHLLQNDPRMYNSMLAFARRHGIIPYESGANSVEGLQRFLSHSREKGIEKTWIEIGPKREGLTIREFVEEPEKRQATLQRFRELARTYLAHYPDFARITIFDEAPLGAFAREEEAGYSEIFREFKRYAPRAFALLYRAWKEEFPRSEVGVFLHHPHNASPEMAGSYSYISEFMRRADSLGAAPDFIFSDVYRGYFNRGYGVEATNRYITDVVRHTKQVAEQHGAKAFHLGQTHTIKLGYTPSRRQIDTNIDAMLKGRPDGIGWYWPNYAATDRLRAQSSSRGIPTDVDVSFDPFIPNSWGRHGPAGSLYGTSRDRFSYAYLRMLEATGRLDPSERFDLWVFGHDFDHAEHSIRLKAADGSWEYIGTVNPQQDAEGYEKGAEEHFYSYNDRWHAVVFRGLSRSRFLGSTEGENGPEFRIETARGDGDGSKLTALYAVPYYHTRHFATEQKVSRYIAEQPRWSAINSLATHIRPVPFELSSDTLLQGRLSGEVPPEKMQSLEQWLNKFQQHGEGSQ